MRTIARFMDARNTAEGKFLSVLLSVLLVFSFLNVTMFTDFANAEDDAEQALVETPEDVDVPEAADEEPATDEVTEPEAEEPQEEAAPEQEPVAQEPEKEVTETPATEEEPEAEETKAPEAETCPAQKLTYKADDGATIVVDAPEGALPANSSMEAKVVNSTKVEKAVEEAVADEGKQLQSMAAYDITLYNSEGNEIEPAKKVRVSIKGAEVEGTEASVMSIADNGNAQKLADVANADNATVQTDAIEANEQNIYVLVGTLVPIEVPEVTQKPVTIKVVFADTGVVRDMTAMALSWSEEADAYIGEYDLNLGGFTATTKTEGATIEDGKLMLSFGGKDDTDPVTVEVTLEGEKAIYTVNHYKQNLDGSYPEEPSYAQTLEGTVGALTNAQAQTGADYEGFQAKTIAQQIVEESGTVVGIYYDRNTYKLTYNTNGGSYIAPKTGLFGEDVEAFTHVEGTDELACGKETHTHTSNGSYRDGWTRYYYGGCYPAATYDRWGRVNGGGATSPTCGKEEHQHSPSCHRVVAESWNPSPTKQGYTFTGWFTDPECTQLASETVILNGNQTLYAG